MNAKVSFKDVLLRYHAPDGGLAAVVEMYEKRGFSRFTLTKLLAFLQKTETTEKDLLAWASEAVQVPLTLGRTTPSLGETRPYRVGTGRELKGGTAPRLRLPLHHMGVSVGDDVNVTFEKPGRIIVESIK